jgi:hypothetical protein
LNHDDDGRKCGQFDSVFVDAIGIASAPTNVDLQVDRFGVKNGRDALEMGCLF